MIQFAMLITLQCIHSFLITKLISILISPYNSFAYAWLLRESHTYRS